MDLWDAYDSDFCRIEGYTLTRQRPIPDGIVSTELLKVGTVVNEKTH